MNRFWCLFFSIAAVIAVVFSAVGPSYNWWFPGPSLSPLGAQIDDLFYLILVITTVTFIGVHIALGYILWKFAEGAPRRSWFSHGSHTLEVIWSIVPAGILLFIALYQMDVWARYRLISAFPRASSASAGEAGPGGSDTALRPVAEVTARQFEWRIRYPAPGKLLQDSPQPGDLYTVNDLHVPVGRPVLIKLRSDDVLHSFFLPHLRIKQDAVPGLSIPVWFQADKAQVYDLVCAELCGWGHYKMRGQVSAERDEDFRQYLQDLSDAQFDDGTSEKPEEEAAD